MCTFFQIPADSRVTSRRAIKAGLRDEWHARRIAYLDHLVSASARALVLEPEVRLHGVLQLRRQLALLAVLIDAVHPLLVHLLLWVGLHGVIHCVAAHLCQCT